jgi:hypothetical protein
MSKICKVQFQKGLFKMVYEHKSISYSSRFFHSDIKKIKGIPTYFLRLDDKVFGVIDFVNNRNV